MAAKDPTTSATGDAAERTGRPVLPVGYPLGMGVPVESGTAGTQPYQLRFGDKYLYLTESAYKLWLVALDGRSKLNLVEACREQGIDQADAIVDGMLDGGPLVELEDDPVANKDLFEHLRLITTGIGMGNSEEQPTEFKIGLPGLGVRVTVDVRAYAVWSGSNGKKSIAQACREAAEEIRVDPSYLVGQAAVNLALFLREGVAYIDRA